MKNILRLLVFISALSCEKASQTLKVGSWRATLEVQDGEQLPFIFEVNDNATLVIHNAEERITVDEIKIEGDSIRIQTPVFEGFFAGRFCESGNKITGSFIKPSLERVVPFEMVYGEKTRFPDPYVTRDDKPPYQNVAGSWETLFSPDSDEDRYVAKGTFSQEGNIVKGTFRTTTGDYRYLEGAIQGDKLQLSTFDGAHAFLFTATVTDSTLDGIFYSGNHWREPFRAKRNENYALPDAKDLTFLKEGYDQFAFSFPDETGKLVTLEDDRFKNKVTLVQILGSWCPNCLEESKFYVDFLTAHPELDIEIVGLAFEYAPTKDKAFASIQRLKDRLNIKYPILLAQYGTEDKKLANEKLPMLNHVLSYPTTIYMDKNGEVRRIHTGYNGTATGEKHLAFKTDFEEFVTALAAE